MRYVQLQEAAPASVIVPPLAFSGSSAAAIGNVCAALTWVCEQVGSGFEGPVPEHLNVQPPLPPACRGQHVQAHVIEQDLAAKDLSLSILT